MVIYIGWTSKNGANQRKALRLHIKENQFCQSRDGAGVKESESPLKESESPPIPASVGQQAQLGSGRPKT